MKNLKLIFVSIIIAMLTLTSCTNEEAIVQQEEAVKSLAAKTSMQELSRHFNDDGSLDQNDGTTDNNPIGNILFDFCFEFEYPVTLSYNSGATVTINNFDELINVLINMTDNLYIDGIAFPFNVFVFNQASGAVELQTINNENEFVTLIDSCGFDEDDCVYTDDFDPICIEIQDPTGDSFIIQFPNMSYAICEGFTQNDVVACDETVDPGVDDNECFGFVYPVSVIALDGSIIVVNSDEEWETVMYTIQGFNFVYPFDVTLLESGTVQTIVTENDFINLLETCYDIDPVDPCNCTDEYAPICVEVDGQTVTYQNVCTAMCDGFTQADFVDCNDNNPTDCWSFVYPIQLNVNGQVIAINNETELLDITENPSVQYQLVYPFYVTVDGSQETINTPNNFYEIGEWENMCDVVSTTDCWSFVYPIQLNVNGQVIAVNNETELLAIVGNSSVQYQLVYPFYVTVDGSQETIDTPNNFYEIGEWDNMCD